MRVCGRLGTGMRVGTRVLDGYKCKGYAKVGDCVAKKIEYGIKGAGVGGCERGRVDAVGMRCGQYPVNVFLGDQQLRSQ